MAKVLVASVVVALMVAVAGATPSRASAGVGGSPGARGAGDNAAGYRFGLTASITDGTSNTIVTPRKAGGGQQDYP
ncbi:MAG: hypothetical protein ACRDJE_23775 [Dehalococcoidia bacterium]